MANILMGAVTALIILLTGAGCFIAGIISVSSKSEADDTPSRHSAEPTEEQRKFAEGFANMLNYTNRHSM